MMEKVYLFPEYFQTRRGMDIYIINGKPHYLEIGQEEIDFESVKWVVKFIPLEELSGGR